MSIQLDELLQPIQDGSPCGPYIDDSAELYTLFNALEQFAQGKPEQVMGDSVIAAVEPSWAKVQGAAADLLKSTKDLRVACYLTHAMLNKTGFVGLDEGLQLCFSLLNNFWDLVHPQLVIDGDDDPDYRVNAVSYLESDCFAKDVTGVILVASRAAGQFSLQDYRLAIGEIESSAGEKPDRALIHAAFMDVPAEELQQSQDSLTAAIATLSNMVQLFNEKISAVASPTFAPLLHELKSAQKVYAEFMAERGLEGAAQDEPTEIQDTTDDAASAQVKPVTATGEVNTREDVIKCIDRICQYYERHEPSSPVPLVLGRAKKMVTMDFMEIMKDVSPDSVQQIMHLAGLEE